MVVALALIHHTGRPRARARPAAHEWTRGPCRTRRHWCAREKPLHRVGRRGRCFMRLDVLADRLYRPGGHDLGAGLLKLTGYRSDQLVPTLGKGSKALLLKPIHDILEVDADP